MPGRLAQVIWGGPACAMTESITISTLSNSGGQPPLSEVIVHINKVESPMVSPVTTELGSFGLVTVPVPAKILQVPVSVDLGVLPARVDDVVLQISWAGPASAIVVKESEVIVTSEVLGAQPPNPEVMVHLSTVVSPTLSPVTADVSEFMEDANPVPEIVDHVPVSVLAAVLAASVVVVALHRFCVGPAAATVMAESTLMVTSEVVGAHPPN